MSIVEEYCIRLGLNKKDLAKAVGVCSNTVMKWQSGTLPRPAALLKLAEVFKMDPIELYHRMEAEREGMK